MDELNPIVDLASHVTRKLIVAVRATDGWIAFDGNETLRLSENIRRGKIILHDDKEFSLSFVAEFDLKLGAVGALTSLTPPTKR